jgi:hypothetical protein
VAAAVEQEEKIVLRVDLVLGIVEEEEQVLMLVVVAVEVLDIHQEQLVEVVLDQIEDVVGLMAMLDH